MQHGMQGHVAKPHEPTRKPRWRERTRTHGRGHASPRKRPGGTTWHEEGAGKWKAHVLVGPSNSIGAVMH